MSLTVFLNEVNQFFFRFDKGFRCWQREEKNEKSTLRQLSSVTYYDHCKVAKYIQTAIKIKSSLLVQLVGQKTFLPTFRWAMLKACTIYLRQG